MPYLRITCPALDPERRREIADALTDAVVELFTPPRGPSADDIRARTTVHYTSYDATSCSSAADPPPPKPQM
jgi:hypothetical protein